MKDEYSPYWAGKLASKAYAMPWGTTTAPTVMPATRSPISHCTLYMPIQERKGNRL